MLIVLKWALITSVCCLVLPWRPPHTKRLIGNLFSIVKCLTISSVKDQLYFLVSHACIQSSVSSALGLCRRVNRTGMHWDYFQLGAPSFHICRVPGRLGTCVLSVFHWHTVALPHLPRITPVVTNAPYGCLLGNLLYCKTQLHSQPFICCSIIYLSVQLHVIVFAVGLVIIFLVIHYYL